MVSSEDLEFPINANSFLCLEWPETFSCLTEWQENPSLLVSENEHIENVGFVPVPVVASDVHPAPLIENSNINDQETLARPSSIGQETTTLTQNQSFQCQRDDYPEYFIAVDNFHDMPSFNSSDGQRESVYSGNDVLTSTNKMMTTGLPSIDSQHGLLKQSHQQPLLCQTVPDFSEELYVSEMVMSTIQEVEETSGLQDHHFYPPMFQEEEYDHNNILLEKLKRIHENEQMHQPKSSNTHTPISMGATMLNNQCQNPFPSTPNTITNPNQYHTPMISNTPTLQKSGNYSPLKHTSNESDPFTYAFQNSSSLKPSRRTRGRPRRYEINFMPSSLSSTTPKNIPLVPTTQLPLTSPRHNYGQDKGKQHVTAMPFVNPILHNQSQNSYTNSMIQQSGELRQRNCYDDQFENECPSKIRRIMVPFQDKSIADSSIVSSWQDGNMRSNVANHHEERFAKNTVYDPLYASVGLPIDPHLRSL